MSWRSRGAVRCRLRRSRRISEFPNRVSNGGSRSLKVDDRVKPGQTTVEASENRELKKRVRLLEQENEVLRCAAAY